MLQLIEPATKQTPKPLFRWDPSKKRFIRQNGQIVSIAEVTRLRDSYLDQEKAINLALAQKLFNKEIDINQWYGEMRQNLRRVYAVEYALGKGGFGNMEARDWGVIGSRLKEEYKYLDSFTREIVGGRYTVDQAENVASRMQLYAQNSGWAYERGVLESHLKDGNYLKWNYSFEKEHCGDCSRLNGQVHTAKEWLDSGWAPKARHLGCHGIRCGCYYTEAEGPSVGSF